MKRFLRWLTLRLPCRIIAEDERPYMERYFLANFLGITFYIHRFVGSDPDRGIHDHPWPWALSLILSGWYLEHSRSGTKPVLWTNFLLADSFHRVELPPNVDEVWTLFIHRDKKAKNWGFWTAIDGGDDVAVYEKYVYGPTEPRSFNRWWKTAPKGREVPFRKEA